MPFIPSEIFRGKNPPIQMKTDHSGPNNNNATESVYTRCTVPISNLCRYHKESQSMNLDVHCLHKNNISVALTRNSTKSSFKLSCHTFKRLSTEHPEGTSVIWSFLRS